MWMVYAVWPREQSKGSIKGHLTWKTHLLQCCKQSRSSVDRYLGCTRCDFPEVVGLVLLAFLTMDYAGSG